MLFHFLKVVEKQGILFTRVMLFHFLAYPNLLGTKGYVVVVVVVEKQGSFTQSE
jgi:hypothetical protein